jgi:hypothetical protein
MTYTVLFDGTEKGMLKVPLQLPNFPPLQEEEEDGD